MKTVNIPVTLRSFIMFLFNLCLSYSTHLPKQPPIYSTANLFYITISYFIFLKTFMKIESYSVHFSFHFIFHFHSNLFHQHSVQFSCTVMSNSLWPHGLQHARPSCPSPTPRGYWNSCPLSRWCHPAISSSVVPFCSCLQSFPASGSFQMSQFCASSGQSFGASASTSVLPMNIQDWFSLRLTGWISLHSKGLSRVFSNTIVQKHQFLNAQLSW